MYHTNKIMIFIKYKNYYRNILYKRIKTIYNEIQILTKN